MVLEQSLERYPKNIYALYALEQAHDALGDATRAQAAAQRLRKVSVRGPVNLRIERL